MIDPRIRRTRLYVIVTLIYGGMAFALAMLKNDLVERLHVDPLILGIITVLLSIAAFAPILMLYLRGSLSFPIFDNLFEIGRQRADEPSLGTTLDFESLRSEIHTIRRELALSKRGNQELTDDDRTAMLQALREQFAETIANEFAARESSALAEKLGLLPVRHALESSNIRLCDELAALGRRGNLNLVIGTLTTCVAVALLIYMVLGHATTSTTIPDLIAYYIPRISTVVFIEIFGFFFLRLYKAGLTELKYYQNELTTLSLIGVAVEMVSRQATAESFTDLARSLVQCDRNRSILAQISPNGTDDHVLGKASALIQELVKLIPPAKK